MASAIETAAEEAVDENHDEYALPMPQVVALCEFDASFIGLCALGDPLAEVWSLPFEAMGPVAC